MATIALPVPRDFVGNSSGESAYSTPYMTLLVNVYPQFQPSKAFEVRAVVPAKRNTPVRARNVLSAELYLMGTSVGEHTGGNGEGTLAAQVGYLYKPACYESARNTNNAENHLLWDVQWSLQWTR